MSDNASEKLADAVDPIVILLTRIAAALERIAGLNIKPAKLLEFERFDSPCEFLRWAMQNGLPFNLRSRRALRETSCRSLNDMDENKMLALRNISRSTVERLMEWRRGFTLE